MHKVDFGKETCSRKLYRGCVMFLQHYTEAGNIFGRKVAFSENIKIHLLDDLTVKRSSDFINHCQDGNGLRAEKTRRTDLTEKVWGPAHELAFWGRRSYYGVDKTYILQIMKAQHYK